MLHTLLVNLQDPTYEAVLLACAAIAVAAVTARGQLSFDGMMAFVRNRTGSIELQNQSWSGNISLILLAVGGVIGYMDFCGALTATCAMTLSKIATANDLRMQYGQGYMANGNVTAAAIADANGNTYGITADPRDWAAAATDKYTWTATQTNGVWSYTAACPGTHAGWTTVLLQGGGTTHTQLEWIGPNGHVQAV
jgi:phage tail sheath gpL-like